MQESFTLLMVSSTECTASLFFPYFIDSICYETIIALIDSLAFFLEWVEHVVGHTL